jgi:uncharacterized protein (TIGR00297 family)
MVERALLGAIVAALVTALARRLQALDESGQWAAFACGILASAGGWPWAGVLVGYFVLATAVTTLGEAEKQRRTERSVPQVNTRNAFQVAANGGVFALLAARAGAHPESIAGLASAGALAAASADTWATEIGTLWGGTPRSILTGRRVASGMSGGLTTAGTLAAVVGAAIVGIAIAALHSLPVAGPVARAVTIGGIAGCLADSLLGATVQARRWCEHCREWTERRVHPCSYRTVHAAGFRWMSNDMVNLSATVIGAAAAVAAGRVAS